MTFRDDLLPDIDDIRGIPGDMGLRGFAVFILIRRWSGTRVGDGTATDAPLTQLYVAGGTQPCKVELVSQADIVRSGGVLTARDLRVGPITPTYATGGVSAATIEPSVSSAPTEIFWKVTHRSLPAGGAWFDKYSDESDSNFGSYVLLRANGKTP